MYTHTTEALQGSELRAQVDFTIASLESERRQEGRLFAQYLVQGSKGEEYTQRDVRQV